MNCNYIRSQDPETIKKLRQLGFVVLEEKNGIVTFMNDPATIRKFMEPENLAVTFTNKIEI
jgi:hypothetical protein